MYYFFIWFVIVIFYVRLSMSIFWLLIYFFYIFHIKYLDMVLYYINIEGIIWGRVLRSNNITLMKKWMSLIKFLIKSYKENKKTKLPNSQTLNWEIYFHLIIYRKKRSFSMRRVHTHLISCTRQLCIQNQLLSMPNTSKLQ